MNAVEHMSVAAACDRCQNYKKHSFPDYAILITPGEVTVVSFWGTLQVARLGYTSLTVARKASFF